MAWDDAPPKPEELKSVAQAVPWDQAPPTKEELAGKGASQRPWYSITPQGLLDSFETAGRSVNEMASLGISEPLTSGANALIGQGRKALTGDDSPGNKFTLDNLKAAYVADIERRQKMKEDNSVANIGGQMIGGVVPGSLSGKLATKTAQTVGGLLKSEAGNVPGLVNLAAQKGLIGSGVRTAGKIATGAVEGAALAPVTEIPRRFVEQNTGFEKPEDVAPLSDVALLGAKVGAGVSAAGPLFSGVKKIAKGVGGAVLGVSPENMDYYMAHAKDVNGAKSIEELKAKVDGIVGGLRDQVEQGQMSVDQAKDTLAGINQSASEMKTQAGADFRDQKFAIDQEFKRAQENLESAFTKQKSALTETKSPIHIADDVHGAISDLQNKVSQGSQESYAILDKDPKAYSVKGASQVLRNIADDLNIKAFDPNKGPENSTALVNNRQSGAPNPKDGVPFTSHTAGIQNEINAWADRIDKMPDAVPASELKKILQQIDNSEKAHYQEHGFDSNVSRAYKQIRATIDDAVKTNNPDYAAKMAEVSGNTQLLNHAIERFGDPRATVSRLNQIGSRTAGADQGLLRQLGASTERDFQTPIDQYTQAQNTLKDPQKMQSIRQSLPENQALEQVQAQRQSMAHPSARDQFVQAQLEKSGLLSRQAQAEQGLESVQSGLIEKQGKLEPFKNLTENNSESRLRGLMKSDQGKNIEIQKQFEQLSKLSDTDFEKAVNDLRVKESFEKGNKTGSRNVNLWSIGTSAVGAAVGALVHGAVGAVEGGGAGAGFGAGVGAIMDHYGPAVAKKILDGVISVRNSPTMQTVQSLNLPPQVKLYLANGIKQQSQKGLLKSADTEDGKGLISDDLKAKNR